MSQAPRRKRVARVAEVVRTAMELVYRESTAPFSG